MQVTAESINALFRAAAKEGPLKDILGIEAKELTAADYRNDARSAIVDEASTTVMGGTQVKVLAW